MTSMSGILTKTDFFTFKDHDGGDVPENQGGLSDT
jgi:hypothetical protein